MQMGFYFDQTRCTGCFTCIVACKDYNNIEPGPASWRKVTTLEKGRYPELFVAFLSSACYHCIEPACAIACPAGAIFKRELDGIVLVDREVCLGKDDCGICFDACPYQAPQFGTEKNAKMHKCHFCLDQLAEKKNPVCVDACPMRALDAGPMVDLIEKYGDQKEAEAFTYFVEIGPSAVFKPKKDTRGLDDLMTTLAPAACSPVGNSD
jgi:anaerobic dimethyl sulfoxide reductase subunit B (iron-sulfur subunit)